MSVRIVLADDHALVREGFKALLESHQDWEVVATVATGREAVAAVKSEEPDVVILDLSMPDMNGLEAATRILHKHDDVRVLILSMHRDREYVTSALREGVHGYVVKGAPAEELALAIETVLKGDVYVSPSASGTLLRDAVNRAEPAGPFSELTPRQREVLQLIAEGHSTAEIASTLFVSGKTVESHRAAIQERLGIHDVPGLVRYAIRNGLTSL